MFTPTLELLQILRIITLLQLKYKKKKKKFIDRLVNIETPATLNRFDPLLWKMCRGLQGCILCGRACDTTYSGEFKTTESVVPFFYWI